MKIKIAFFLIVIFAIIGGIITHSFAAEADLHYAELREALFSECEQAKGTVEALEYIAKDSKAESLNALESVFYEFAARNVKLFCE